MLVMAREKGLKVYYRTTPKLKGLYDGLMGKLRATDTFSSIGSGRTSRRTTRGPATS
jgi:hypothetical protein